MKKIIFSLLIFIYAKSSFGQHWTELMHQKDANLYTIQTVAKAYWDTANTGIKGRGYKAYKRWEDHVTPRVFPSGELSVLSQNAKNFEDFVQSNSTNTPGHSKQIGNTSIINSSNWTLIGPIGAMSGVNVFGLPHKAGRDNFITFHPSTANTYWAGAAAGGLWKTTNNGSSWTTTTDNLNVIGCTDLAVDPSNTNILYLATGDGEAGDTPSIGVYKSTDGGLTWSATGLTATPNINLLIHRLLINPGNTQIIIAGTNAGIYRTINGGTSWTQVSTINAYDLEFKPGDPTTVYASGSSFYLSTNSGASFTQVSSGIPTTGCNRMSIAVTTHTAGLNYVYVIASTSSASDLNGIYRSTNSGVSFSLMANSPNLLVNSCAGTGTGGQGWYDLAIAASPLNADEVVVGGVNHWKSTNGGSTWSIIGCWSSTGSNPPFVHADVHELEYSPTGVLYSASDGGISQYTGTSWTDVSGNRNIAEIYRIGISSLSPNLWLSGHQDNGSNIYNGTTYNASYGGDGMDCFIDKSNNSNFFASSQNGGLVKSTNGGASWLSAASGITGSSNWLCPWKQSTGPSNVIYAGFNSIWSSTNQGTSWTSLAAFSSTAGSVIEFAIAPTNSLVMYALKSNAVYYTSNGGASWSNVTGTIPLGSALPTYIAIDAANPAVAWVTLSGYSSGNKVFMTSNSGGSWTNVSFNLPNLPSNCVVNQPGTNGQIYVGMDVGVYYKDNTTTTWTLYNVGLPNTVINDLEISPAAPGKLRAATFGRGVYEVDVVVSCVNTPTVTVSNQTICPGSTATLSASGSSVYAWNTGATTSVTVVSPTLTTVYTVTAGISSCTDITTATVYVLSAPVQTLSASAFSFCTAGTLTLTSSGASTYTWTGPSVTSTNNPFIYASPVAGIYTVTGSSGQCSSSQVFTLTETTAPRITASSSQSTVCAGNCVTLSATGANTYVWNPGTISGSATAVCPTIAVIYTVTGSNGVCTDTKTTAVNVVTLPTLTVSPNQTICAGSCASLTVAGTATGFTWQPSNSTGSISVVCPSVSTVYSVVAGNGLCTSFNTVAVNLNGGMSISISPLALCMGSSGTLTATGATNYTWSTGATGNSIVVSPSSTAVYTVFGSDGICTGTASSNVLVTAVPNITISSVLGNTICSGVTAVLSALGGCTYTWNTSATTSSIAVSPTSTSVYSVTTSCSGCVDTKTIGLTVVSVPLVTISPASPSICAGSSITLSASGADQYTWSSASTNTSIVVNPTVSTSYTVSGTATLTGCGSGTTININVSPLPIISVNSGSICSGQSFTILPSGANTYTISGGSTIVSPGSDANYSVTGTSSAGCLSAFAAVSNVTVNAIPTISVNSGSICRGQSFVIVPGGANTYTYSGGSNTVSPSSNTSYSVSGTSTAGCVSNIAAVSIVTVNTVPIITVNSGSICNGQSFTISPIGANTYTYSGGSNVVSPTSSTSYSVSGTSTNGCVSNIAAVSTVTVNAIPVISVNSGSICSGQSFTILPTGASSYTYSGGTNTVSPISNTNYSVTGTSIAGCVSALDAVSSVTVNAIPVISVNSGSICSGQSFTISPIGANTYTYSSGSNIVSPGSNTTYSVSGSSTAGCVSSVAAVSSVTVRSVPVISVNSGAICNGQTFTILPSGANTYTISGGSTIVSPTSNTNYSVTGTSTDGCVSTVAAISNVTVNAIPAISVNSGSICNGQTFTISPIGANTYTISGGSTIVSPSSNSNYSVSGTSTAGCVSNIAAVSAVTVNAIPVISVNSGSICNGQSFTILPSGANTYTYSGGSAIVSPTSNTTYSVSGTSTAGCVSNAVAVSNVTVYALPVISVNSGSICSGQSFVIVPSGANTYTYSGGSNSVSPSSNTSYSVSGTSTAGCVSIIAAVSIVTVNSVPVITVNSGAICNGQSFTISPGGANTYTISGGSTIVSPTSNTNYSVTGTSTDGCVSAVAAISNVTVNAIPAISVNSGSICNGQTFTILPSGANTYTYSGGSNIVSPGSNTNYSVSGTSTAGCVSSIVAISTVTVKSIPVISVNSGSICNGQSFTILPSGANTYTISGGSTIVSPVSNTNYSVTGTSTDGCISTVAAISIVTVNTIPVISVNSGSICNGQSFTISPIGANTYTYSGGLAIVSPTSNATYSVTGTSSAGCVSALAAVSTVTVNAIPVISANSGSICNGQSFTILPSGANTYTYSGGSNIVSPTSNATYSVSGTSSAGCVSALAAVSSVTVNAIPVISVNSGSICNGQSFTILPSGANTYTFSGGSAIVSPTSNANYSVTGSSTAGCISSIAAISIVTVNALPIVCVNSGTICSGRSFTISPGCAVTYTIIGGSSIVSPPTTTSYSIFGTSIAGCVSAIPAISNVTVIGLPSISANSGSICSGQSFTILPSGANTYTFSGGSAIVSPTSNATYSVTGTSSAGCVSALAAVSSVTVNSIPVISVNSGSICNGQSFTILPSGANTYTYSGGSAIVSPTSNATYSVSGTSTAGCISTLAAVSSVTVNAVPVISVNSGSICNGQPFTILPGGANTYTYSGGSAIVSPTSNINYSVTGTSTAGCVSALAAVSSVTVNSIPVISVNSGSICNGQSFTVLPSGANTYTYSGGSAVVSPTSNATYSVTGTSTAGCVSNVVAVSSVTVYALPVISVNSGSICNGQSFTIVASGANTYTYSGGSNIVSPSISTSYSVIGTSSAGCVSAFAAVSSVPVASRPVISANSGTICNGSFFVINPSGASTFTYSGGSATVSPNATTSYSVSGTSNLGCVSSTPAISTVTVYALPVVTANASATTICQGNTVSLNGGGANTYSWSSGVTNAIPFSPSVTVTYTVTGFDLNSCKNTASVMIKVSPLPNLIMTSSNSLICAGESCTITCGGANTYTWSTSQTGTNIIVSPSLTTSYSVTGSNGCLNTAATTVSVNACSGITQITGGKLQVAVYPNPNSGEFVIETRQDLHITLYNSLGQIILQRDLVEGKHTIDIKDHSKGIYFLELKQSRSLSGENISRIKLVAE